MRRRPKFVAQWRATAISTVAALAAAPSLADHWAFRPITDPPPPPGVAATDIDRFVVARLTAQGLNLSPPAAKRALIRRATFDLTGLPPTWDEVQAFIADERPDAFAAVVDRLLASSRYGERWGRHWLDIARYADTQGGGGGDQQFAFAYTYRDYVINAFNNDVPYNQFVLEQLAADQLGLTPNAPQLAALGFLTVGRQFRSRHDVIDDQIDVTTRGLLGLTVACARCHDHKYDPVPTEDYYALYATFASSDAPAELPPLGIPPNTDAYRDYQRELDLRQRDADNLERDQCEVMRGRLRMQVGMYLREIVEQTPEYDLSNVFLSYRTDDLRPLVLERWREYLEQTVDADDPVFGPWHQLAQLPAAGFAVRSRAVLDELRQTNNVPEKPKWHKLANEPLRWNTRVLDTLQACKPNSMLDVANAYGNLFADVHTEWQRALLETSREALPEVAVVPDEHESRELINHPANRQLRRHLYGAGTPTALPRELAVTVLNRPARDRVRDRRGAIDQVHLLSPGSAPRAMALAEAKMPALYHVFHRGNPLDLGPQVEPRFLQVLSGHERRAFPAGKQRLALARAIVDRANPLTRRVVVNWVWQHHLGRGLVRSPDDFGTQGEPPTHPQLLDYLASTFADQGWSLKKLHRRIMLTSVYRQAALEDSAARLVDPHNRLLWRMPRRRLEMEAMRDAMLAVAGRLDTAMGGRPFQLFGEPSTPRRTVYGLVNRHTIPSMFSAFDMSDPSACTARRPHTTVPQQALFALNSAFIVEQARHLAAMPHVANAASDRERITAMYRQALARLPGDEEMAMAVEYVQRVPADAAPDGWERFAHVLLASNEFVFLD